MLSFPFLQLVIAPTTIGQMISSKVDQNSHKEKFLPLLPSTQNVATMHIKALVV